MNQNKVWTFFLNKDKDTNLDDFQRHLLNCDKLHQLFQSEIFEILHHMTEKMCRAIPIGWLFFTRLSRSETICQFASEILCSELELVPTYSLKSNFFRRMTRNF